MIYITVFLERTLMVLLFSPSFSLSVPAAAAAAAAVCTLHVRELGLSSQFRPITRSLPRKNANLSRRTSIRESPDGSHRSCFVIQMALNYQNCKSCVSPQMLKSLSFNFFELSHTLFYGRRRPPKCTEVCSGMFGNIRDLTSRCFSWGKLGFAR